MQLPFNFAFPDIVKRPIPIGFKPDTRSSASKLNISISGVILVHLNIKKLLTPKSAASPSDKYSQTNPFLLY